ncbi:hypothetical protein K502DRAFT_331886 [Neoconidiobolus thromboides FSU 785]|nr:hypothetical protein K502DRAFT_331886 [Neoconidiobolus thromboides FSU 785]
MFVEYENKLWNILHKEHAISGRGSAKIKLELSLVTGNLKKVERFKPGDTLDVKTVKPELYQYLYSDGEEVHLLHPETYDQISLPEASFSGNERGKLFLEDGMNVYVDALEGETPISFRLPENYKYEVVSVDIKKQASRGVSNCPATLKNGVTLTVPEFVKPGDFIIVDLLNLKYKERA